MKKILLMSLSMVFLCSCSFKEKEVIADPTITVEPAPTQNIEEDTSERDYRGLVPGTSNIKDQIKEKYGADELLTNQNTGKLLRTNYSEEAKKHYEQLGGTPDLDYGYTIFLAFSHNHRHYPYHTIKSANAHFSCNSDN